MLLYTVYSQGLGANRSPLISSLERLTMKNEDAPMLVFSIAEDAWGNPFPFQGLIRGGDRKKSLLGIF